MYKLVIVEDEKDVRNRILSLIDRAGSNFEVVGEYETGIDAYDGILSESPDLILTDIKIPYINGIELAKRIRQALPLVKIVIITGYNEFDYAKEAANLGVVGFISKPVTLEDVAAHLKKAEEALDDEYFTSSSLSQFQSFYESSLPIIRENDLYRLSNMSEPEPSFENKLRHYGVDLNYRYFTACLFDFDETHEGDIEKYDLAFSSVRKYLEEALPAGSFELFNRYEKLCLLLKHNDQPDVNEIESTVERIIQRIGRYSGISLSAGISNVHENSRNFAAIVREAQRALEYRRVIGGGRAFFFGNTGSSASGSAVDDNLIKEIGYNIHYQTAEKCVENIEQIRLSLSGSRQSHHYVVTSILNVLIKACDDLEGLYSRYDGPDNLYRRFFEIKTDHEVFDFLKELVFVIRELNDSVIKSNVNRNLENIILYMEKHFCDENMSFLTLSEGVNFSISYISALLKKNLNTSFVKLLTSMRMEKAKELLGDPDLKIIDVAERLGYSDSYYFSHCFKKYFGLSPKEFRANETFK